MRISAVEEYGLRCLLQLAQLGKDGQMSISEIAEKEGLSVPYASKLLAILRKAGLVVAERGRGGGFSIATDPENMNMYEALVALGGPLIDPHHCQKYGGQLNECIHVENCSVQDILGGLAGYIQEFLSQKTLADLVNHDSDKLITPEKMLNRVVVSDKALESELTSFDADHDSILNKE